MYQIDVMSRIPVYEQIINQTRRFVMTGVLQPGDKLPSVRHLSMELSLNPNTVQKALMELDRQGIVVSSPGKGCYVTPGAKRVLAKSARQELEGMKGKLEELSLAGVTRKEVLSLVDEVFPGEEQVRGGRVG